MNIPVFNTRGHTNHTACYKTYQLDVLFQFHCATWDFSSWFQGLKYELWRVRIFVAKEINPLYKTD